MGLVPTDIKGTSNREWIMACSQKIEKMMIRREWETERQKELWSQDKQYHNSESPSVHKQKKKISQFAHMGNTMEGKTVENRCPKSKLKTSLEITNIKINQLPHLMMSQNYVYIDTID